MDIYTTPAMEAPEGKTSNLIDPTSLMTTRIGLCSAVLAVVLVFVSIRVYTRCVIKMFNFEDCKPILGCHTYMFTCSIMTNLNKGFSSSQQCAFSTMGGRNVVYTQAN